MSPPLNFLYLIEKDKADFLAYYGKEEVCWSGGVIFD